MTQGAYRLLVVLTLLIFESGASAGQILQCVDKNDHKVFTDDPRICAARAGRDTPVEPLDVSPLNLHSQFGETVSEEYRNYSFRSYSPVPGYSIKLMAEDELIEESSAILRKASAKLDRAMAEAVKRFPSGIRDEFSGVTYYIFTGAEVSGGVRKGGQWYFRRGNSTSKRFDDSIVVRSASQYLSYTHVNSVATGVHELAHAYYFYHRRALYWDNHKAYQNAVQRGLYKDVKTKTGYKIPRAYALTDELEYFAEISKIYLYKNHHYPFMRADLEVYDPMAFKLMRTIYGF